MTKVFTSCAYVSNELLTTSILATDEPVKKEDIIVANLVKTTLGFIAAKRLDLIGQPITFKIIPRGHDGESYEFIFLSEDLNKIYQKMREINFR